MTTKCNNNNKSKKQSEHVQAEHLMSLPELAAAAGMSPRNVAFHIERWEAKGLVRVKIEGGYDKFTASSWNKIINEAIEKNEPL